MRIKSVQYILKVKMFSIHATQCRFICKTVSQAQITKVPKVFLPRLMMALISLTRPTPCSIYSLPYHTLLLPHSLCSSWWLPFSCLRCVPRSLLPPYISCFLFLNALPLLYPFSYSNPAHPSDLSPGVTSSGEAFLVLWAGAPCSSTALGRCTH